jgi:tetratricopeptide (TPR) repeat protein
LIELKTKDYEKTTANFKFNIMKWHVILYILFATHINIYSQKKNNYEETINDSASIYSINPKKPFKYGFPYNKKQCDEYFSYYNGDFKIKNGDTVADIGAASGWMDAMLSIYLDSVTFYIQDIDTLYSSQVELDKAVNYFSQFRSRPQTNKFIFILGTEKSTNLPNGFFDKIILNNTFHEISKPFEIIEDIKSKLKPNGEVLIREGFSNKFRKNKLSGCNIVGYKSKDVIEYFELMEFNFICAAEPENSFTNCLTFSLSNNKKSFSFRNPETIYYIELLDKLNKKSIAKDSLKTKEILNELILGKIEIHETYRTMENYLDKIGGFYFDEKKYIEALNVFKIELALYPNSQDVYTSIGLCYELLNKKKYAIVYYKMALNKNPDDEFAKELLKTHDLNSK